jgi:preprotein translocase subunit SecD
MERVRWGRVGVILFVFVLSVVYILPSLPSFYGVMYGYLPRDLQASQGVSKPAVVDGALEFQLDALESRSSEALNKGFRRLATTLRERARILGLTDVRINDSRTPLDDAKAIQRKLRFAFVDPNGRSAETILSQMQLYGKLPLGLRGWLFPESRVQLGLDLKGGVYLALELDLAEAEAQVLSEANANIRTDLRDRYRVNCREVKAEGNALTVLIRPSADWGAAGDTKKADTEKYFDDLENFTFEIQNGGAQDADGNIAYRLTLKPDAMSDQTDQALTQVLEVLRNRVDAFGVAEPDIRREPNKPRVIVQLPGAQDSSTAASVVRTMGRLEFRMVHQKDGAPMLGQGTPPTPDQLPPDTELFYSREGEWLVLEGEPVVTGRDISRATTQQNFAEIVVAVKFNANGRRAFGDATAAHVGELMAIVLDNTVVSYPRIREPILGGECTISGGFDQESASELARILRAGAFPVGVKIAEERTVGPSLGREAIRKGTLAALFGITAVLIFMTFYYSICGTFAVVALVMNALLILAALALLGATLTLPGLAGLVLTMGMAVDANVLINERIKEELHAGKTISAAINAGYGRVFWTIFDSNVTTVLTAIVLIQFGTGSIRGFGVTLTIGIVTSMFTALFVTRELFRLFEGKSKALQIYPLLRLRKA